MLHLGLIGYPLEHSLSPFLHQFLLEAMDIEGEYTLYETPPGRVNQGITLMKTYGVTGFNVTIPHKMDILPHTDYLDETAKLLKAVNTVSIVNGQYRGYNTDLTGFLKSLPASLNGNWKTTSALIMGAGGVVRPVLAGLLKKDIKSIRLGVRQEVKAGEATAQAQLIKKQYQATTHINWALYKDLVNLEEFNLVINATPVGMHPDTDNSLLSIEQLQTLPPNATVIDLIYNPLETKLLKEANALGLNTVNGLDMLIYQGVAAFELWTGKEVPDSIIPKLKEHLINKLES